MHAAMVTERRKAKLTRIAALRDLAAAVVLEDIHDPHNAAASFRSCDAFGIQTVHLIFEQEKPFNPRREGKKTSGHTNKWLDFHIHHGTDKAIRALKEAGYTLIATRVDPAAKPLPTLDLSAIERPAFVFGNEHRGISETMAQAADHLVWLPMVGMAESFNLSVSVALTLAEYFGQKRLGRAPVPEARIPGLQGDLTDTAETAAALDAAHAALLARWLEK